MGFANVRDLVEAETFGQSWYATFRKVPAVVTGAGTWYDYASSLSGNSTDRSNRIQRYWCRKVRSICTEGCRRFWNAIGRTVQLLGDTYQRNHESGAVSSSAFSSNDDDRRGGRARSAESDSQLAARVRWCLLDVADVRGSGDSGDIGVLRASGLRLELKC